MKEKRSQVRSPKAQRKAAVRASITFPPDLYVTLEEIAKQKKVSLAWVVREAAERYVAEETVKGGDGQKKSARATGQVTRKTT